MRILHCIPNMAGGGAERQLTYLAQAQSEHGHDIHVVLCGGGPNLDRLQTSGASLHFLRGRGNHDPLLLVRLSQLISRLRPTIVQTWLLQMDVLGGIASALNGIPFVLSERSSSNMYPRTFKWKMREAIARRSAAVIANSSGGLDYWRSVLPKQHTCFVVPNALPLDEIAAVSPLSLEDTELPEDVPKIVFVGRLSEEKRVDLLFDIFSLVAAATGAVLILCGQGSEESNLRDRVDNDVCLKGRVFFMSYQPNVWGLMKSCNHFASLSRFEGCPNAVMEASACGLPLFLSDIPAHRAVVGDNAWYVSENPVDAARVLIRSLEESERNFAMVEAAKEVIQYFSPREIALHIDHCYEQILAKRNHRGN